MSIETHFDYLTKEQISQFELAEELYRYWNEKINLISRKDIDRLYTHHFLHALGIAKIISFLPDTKVMDVGTGGGFPGIPLAIIYPKTKFWLVDSIGKKIQVVQDIAKQLGLKNVVPIHQRAESIDLKFDFIVSRAVTALPRFVSWVSESVLLESRHSLENGILYLKGGDLQSELVSFKKYKVFELSDYFSDSFFLTKKLVHLPRQSF